MADEHKDYSAENYERIILAIAILYSNMLGIDISKTGKYSDLSAGAKQFADKILQKNPRLMNLASSIERLSEQQIVEETARISSLVNKSKQVRIVTAGDGTVCPKCKKWQGKIVSLDGKSRPTLQDAIDDGFLHYGCRCSLQEIGVQEIPLNKNNPRYEARAAANPRIYNSSIDNLNLVFL